MIGACGKWVWSMGGGYTVYLKMKYCYILCFLAALSLFSVQLFYILVFVSFRFLKFHKGENNIRVLSTYNHPRCSSGSVRRYFRKVQTEDE